MVRRPMRHHSYDRRHGFSPRDVTPEATRQVIQRDAPGLAELLRWTGYQKLDRAVLSRGVAGIRGRTRDC